MLGWLKGHALKTRLTEPRDELWDRRLGVHTFGYHEGSGTWGKEDWVAHYQPLSYRQIFLGLKAAGAKPGDHLTDLGCGLGRAVFAAAQAGVGRVTGVELVPELAAAAEANRKGSKIADRNIRIVQGDALEHDLGDTTLLYCFHALNHNILTEVLARLRRRREEIGTTQPFRMIYANPVFDEEVLAKTGWLKRTVYLPPEKEWLNRSPPYATSIWVAE